MVVFMARPQLRHHYTKNKPQTSRYLAVFKRHALVCALIALPACTTLSQDKLSEAITPIAAMGDTAPSTLVMTGTAVAKDSVITTISKAALEVSEETSAARANVTEQKLAYEELKWDGLPSLVPTVNLTRSRTTRANSTNSLNNREFRVSLQQDLVDFGRHAGRKKQALSRIDSARIEHWQERNNVVHDALVHHTDMLRHERLLEESQASVEEHITLQDQIQARIDGGLAEKSELMLIQIRLQELQTQMETDKRSAEASRDILESYTKRNTLSMNLVSNLADKPLDIPHDFKKNAPTILLATQRIKLAKAENKEAKSSLFPRVIAEAYVENVDGRDNSGVALRLSSNTFAGLSYKSKLNSSNARLQTAHLALSQANIEFERDFQQLNANYRNLTARETSLEAQKVIVDKSVDLFFEQFKSGVKPILDSIRVYESALDTRRQLINTQADIRLNRLNLANSLGILAPFPES